MGETRQKNHLWLAGLVAISNHGLLSWRLRKTSSLFKICEWHQTNWREYSPPNVCYLTRPVVSAERFSRNMFRKRKMLYWYLHKHNYEWTNSRSLGAVCASKCLFAAFGSYVIGGNLSRCSPGFRHLWCEAVYFSLASSLKVCELLSVWGWRLHNPPALVPCCPTRMLLCALLTAGVWPSSQQHVGSRGLFQCLCCIQLSVWRCTCCRASGYTWCRRQNGP